jgi:hypothetical protein
MEGARSRRNSNERISCLQFDRVFGFLLVLSSTAPALPANPCSTGNLGLSNRCHHLNYICWMEKKVNSPYSPPRTAVAEAVVYRVNGLNYSQIKTVVKYCQLAILLYAGAKCSNS